MQILKYLGEIKKILEELGCKPDKFLSNGKNKYMICGDIVLVKVKITGIKYIHRYGYFLIDKDDMDLLYGKKYVIYLRSPRSQHKNFRINVSSSNRDCLFKKLIEYKYSFKNKNSKHYIYKNDNSLDLRKTNLEESVNRSKNINNVSGKTGVRFDHERNRWTATYYIDGKIKQTNFSVATYGTDAKKLAYEIRDKWEGKQNLE